MKRRSKSACFAPPLLLVHLPKVQKPRFCSAGMTAFSRFEGCKTVMFSDKIVMMLWGIVLDFHRTVLPLFIIKPPRHCVPPLLRQVGDYGHNVTDMAVTHGEQRN